MPYAAGAKEETADFWEMYAPKETKNGPGPIKVTAAHVQ